eukprot:973783-Heterocapsa_arctica.AAC.1
MQTFTGNVPGFPWHAQGWPQLQQCLQAAGFDAGKLSGDMDLLGAVVGLVEINVVTQWSGPLHRCTAAERFLHELGGRQPMMFLKIARVIRLQAPVPAIHFS